MPSKSHNINTTPRRKSSIKCSPWVVPTPAVMSEELKAVVSTEVQRLLKEALPSFLFDEIECLSVAQIAALTNYSKPSVIEWIRAGKLTAIRPGKEYIVTIADFKKFLNANRMAAKVVQGHFKKGLKQQVV